MGLRDALARWRASGRDPSAAARLDGASAGVTHSSGYGALVIGAAPPAPAPELPRFYTPEPAAGPSAPPAAGDFERASSPQHAEERKRVSEAWDLIGGRAAELVRLFYAELFYALGDEAFGMFPAGMDRQREEFGRVLLQWVTADDPETLAPHLEQLGADHRKFAVEPRHYEAVGQALVTAWSTLAGSAWTPELEQAVIGSYVRLATLMLDGALRQAGQPAVWEATVVGHDRLQRDFAVVRLQPDAPYPYQAGQYLTLEAEALPKQWRKMSIASAPRPDNTLDLHVRAVSATGVSGALVMHTRPGHRIRLGPPRGHNLVVSPDAVPAGLLCVSSGTGSAPICAVVESLLRQRDCPPVYAFVGARSANDLYPVEHLTRLANEHGHGDRLHVHGVVSDDPSYGGFHGRVEQVVPRLRDWAALGVDVLVSGPDPMIAATVSKLTAEGVPIGRIRFDEYQQPD